MPLSEVWERSGAGWAFRQVGAGETIKLNAIDCAIQVDNIYAAAHNA